MSGNKRGRKRKIPHNYSVPYPLSSDPDDDDLANLSEAHEQLDGRHQQQGADADDHDQQDHHEARRDHGVTTGASNNLQFLAVRVVDADRGLPIPDRWDPQRVDADGDGEVFPIPDQHVQPVHADDRRPVAPRQDRIERDRQGVDADGDGEVFPIPDQHLQPVHADDRRPVAPRQDRIERIEAALHELRNLSENDVIEAEDCGDSDRGEDDRNIHEGVVDVQAELGQHYFSDDDDDDDDDDPDPDNDPQGRQKYLLLKSNNSCSSFYIFPSFSTRRQIMFTFS